MDFPHRVVAATSLPVVGNTGIRNSHVSFIFLPLFERAPFSPPPLSPACLGYVSTPPLSLAKATCMSENKKLCRCYVESTFKTLDFDGIYD